MDVIVIGGGPAGISAAIYCKRGGLEVAVVNTTGGSLLKAHAIENYYGFAEPISGPELYRAGLRQAERLGIELIDAETTHIETIADGFEVKTTVGNFTAKAIVLTNGSGRKSPPIPGIKEYEGRGVSYCAVCDAFFYRKKNVCVIGNGEYALEEAGVLSGVASRVELLTDGLPAPETDLVCHTQKIREIAGDGDRVTGVTLEDGQTLSADGVFVAVGTANSSALAAKLGIHTEGDYIAVDENGKTNVPGIYAAGDCTGGLKQIAAAVDQGAHAGLAILKELRRKNFEPSNALPRA